MHFIYIIQFALKLRINIFVADIDIECERHLKLIMWADCAQASCVVDLETMQMITRKKQNNLSAFMQLQ